MTSTKAGCDLKIRQNQDLIHLLQNELKEHSKYWNKTQIASHKQRIANLREENTKLRERKKSCPK